MPELPEVETVRRSLIPHVVGQQVTGMRVGNFPGVLGGVDPPVVEARIRGLRIMAIRRRGKYLILDLDDASMLIIHLRMTGSLVLARRDNPPQRFEHLAIELKSGQDLRFADQRKFGRVIHALPSDLEHLDARMGPEPLTNAFTADVLKQRLGRRTGALKSALLDQRLVAGLGNIYVDEALFRARIHPLHNPSALTEGEVRRLHRAIRAVLREGITNRGTTFSAFRDGSGNEGENRENLRVYGRGRRGEPCPRCSRPLVCITVGGRSTHFCPRCQPETPRRVNAES